MHHSLLCICESPTLHGVAVVVGGADPGDCRLEHFDLRGRRPRLQPSRSKRSISRRIGLLATLMGALNFFGLASPGLAAEEELPPPEATEQWKPVPPVVEAPPGVPPADAIVLFNGQNLDAWEPVTAGGPSWKLEEGAMVVVPQPKPMDQRTKQSFGDVQLHLEFRTPHEVKGKSQERGNSGIYFMGLYELQILDSWKNETYPNGQVASVYKQHIPLANPSRPPGEWQVYDAVFIAPRFAEDGKLISPARMTAFLNGVLVQYDVALRGPTVFRGQPKYQAHAAKLPLVLQDHRNPVGFRNIWIRELTLPPK